MNTYPRKLFYPPINLMKEEPANWLCKFSLCFLTNFYFIFFFPFTRQQAKQKDVDYIFFVDADVHIDDPEVLRELLTLNRYILI